MRGYSAFESFRTYHRQPFRLDEHLDRLYRSAALMELTIPWPREQAAGVIAQVIERNA